MQSLIVIRKRIIDKLVFEQIDVSIADQYQLHVCY